MTGKDAKEQMPVWVRRAVAAEERAQKAEAALTEAREGLRLAVTKRLETQDANDALMAALADLGAKNEAWRVESVRLKQALASAGRSLISYEVSYGGGGGDSQAWEIGDLLGYPEDYDRDTDDLDEFLAAIETAPREGAKPLVVDL